MRPTCGGSTSCGRRTSRGFRGTGVVAVGVKFPNGYVDLQRLNDADARMNGHASDPGGIEDAIRVHGHDGRTEIRWLD